MTLTMEGQRAAWTGDKLHPVDVDRPLPFALCPTPSSAMLHEELHHDDVAILAERAHQLISGWDVRTASFRAAAVHEDTLHYARMAIHEWVANLVQHANFDTRTPRIIISLWSDGRRLHGFIEDNSEGFAPEKHMHGSIEERVHTMPERGMGLLLVKASTEFMNYRRVTRGRYRFEFSVLARGGQHEPV